MSLILYVAELVFAAVLCACLHELAHLVAGHALGRSSFTRANAAAAWTRRVTMPDIASAAEARVVRHAGWVTSVCVAFLLLAFCSSAPAQLAAAIAGAGA